MFYFAYGSNMNVRRMRSRCPDCKYLGAAVLRGFRVVPRLYADLQPNKKSNAYGVLYWVSPADLARLDVFEGYPNTYNRKQYSVYFFDLEICAVVYRMTPETRRKRDGIAYPEQYRKICARGAENAGIKNVFK